MTIKAPSPLFSYLGAKNQLWPYLQPILRRIGVVKIAEPFAGSAVVSRNMPSEQVLLAEACDEVRAILLALRDGEPKRLFRQVLMCQVDPDLQTDLYPEHMLAAQALARRIFKAPMGQDVAPSNNLLLCRLESFKEAHKRFQGAVILNNAWDLIEQHKDDPRVTWFLDPPYPETCQVGYLGGWSMDDHDRLMSMIPMLRGSVVLTGYENMRPEQSLGMKEKAILVVRRIAKGDNRHHTEYIWWRK